MYCVKKMTDDLYWVGGSDRRLALFENVYPIPNGVSYNAYLLLDEKTVLLDTVDRSIADLFFENVAHVLNGRKLDYVIVNHMEPDHCAVLQDLVLRYPEVKIVCNAKTVTMIRNFFTFDIDSRAVIVKEMDITLASGTIAVGETTSLSLGVLPSSASNYANVSLSSSDPAVATVNNFGKVTGVAPGTATITATCGDVSASATVKVVNSGVDRQSIDLNTSYVVLKPGASRTITGKVTPSSASQSLTFKSNDTKVATVSAKGVITAVGTGATSIVVSNGTASASVTVIVNRNASSSGNGGGSTDDSNGEVVTDPVVEAIEADGTDEVTFAQRELPTITGEMLNALRLNGKTLVVEADNYTIRIAGRDVKNTSAQVSTALSFAPSEYGVTFTLNGGEALPGVVQVEMTGDNAAYTRVYLHNALKGKWQFLNSYKDHVLEADTAGEYLLTTQNLRFVHVDMTFFIAGLVVIVGIIIAYIVIKKRYWFW